MIYLKMVDLNIHMVAADQRVVEAVVKKDMVAVEVAGIAEVAVVVAAVDTAGIVGIAEVAEVAEVAETAETVDIVGVVEVVAIAVEVVAIAVEEVAATVEVAVALHNHFGEVVARLALEADILGMPYLREDIALNSLGNFDQICRLLRSILPLPHHYSDQPFSCQSYLYCCY